MLDKGRIQHLNAFESIFGAWIVAGFLPSAAWLVSVSFLQLDLRLEPMTVTAAICSASAMASAQIFLNLSRFPGIAGLGYLFPSTAVPYGLAVVVLLLGRFDYSRAMMASSFFVCLFWLLIMYSRKQRGREIVIGFVPHGRTDRLPATRGVTWRAVRSLEDVDNAMRAIAVDMNSGVSAEWERSLTTLVLRGFPVYDVKELVESLTGKVEIDQPSENRFGGLAPLAPYLKARLLVDRLTALVALIFLSPLFLAVALLIRFDSSGPAFFRQERVGYRGKSFRICKFRTMKVRTCNSETVQSATTSTDDDRITRIGRFLRKSRIDELPQVLNIVRGDMGWIGPRPEARVLSDWYAEEIPLYRYRHIVPPGITGWAQVRQGHVADIEAVSQKLAYDFYYIRHFSFWLDVTIVLMTIKTMLTGYGHR